MLCIAYVVYCVLCIAMCCVLQCVVYCMCCVLRMRVVCCVCVCCVLRVRVFCVCVCVCFACACACACACVVCYVLRDTCVSLCVWVYFVWLHVVLCCEYSNMVLHVSCDCLACCILVYCVCYGWDFSLLYTFCVLFEQSFH
jgi:hypothetical protein